MIIVPDNPGAAGHDEVFHAAVRKVFDGDGFRANVWHPFRGSWVECIPFRFAFIDAPEMGQPGGREAKEFLAGLIMGKELRLDPIGKESTGYLPIDGYKRLLCMGFLTELMEVGRIDYYHDGKCGSGQVKRPRLVTRNIELEMIVNGWAWVVEQYSFEREDEYFEAQEDAQKNRRGLWQMDNPETPWSFKKRRNQHRKSSESQGELL